MSAKLFSPLTIRSLTLKNRIAISPMCQYSAVDGFANNWHLVHLGSRAIGGAGLIVQEATAVTPEGRISPYDLGIWSDEHTEKYKAITQFILSQGAIPGIQLAHAGRKGSTEAPWNGGRKILVEQGGYTCVAPSAIPFRDEEPVPVAMETAEVRQMVDHFRVAARRALEAGYKVIELHAAHGYLIHQFMSPLSNRRKDEYGGSFENRVRFLLEIITAVQLEWPSELPIFVRISATDWADGGWNADESVQLAVLLRDKGVDLIDVSSGGNVPHQQIPVGPLYQLPFAERIKSETGIRTGAVGLITESRQAEDIIVKEQADLVFFARESLRDPNLPLTFARELKADIKWPNQYERAQLKS